ncbi:hypothetical protein OIV83_006438 [Microbotryomycetes sp. JL201]|nr:hypothetical protein OIV83_006438 [Microbotryomycetes sp. JL201]
MVHPASLHALGSARPAMSSRLMHSTSSSSSGSDSDGDDHGDALPQRGAEWPERAAAAAAAATGSAAAVAAPAAHSLGTASHSSLAPASAKHARREDGRAGSSSDEQETYDVSPLPSRGTITKPKGVVERKQQHHDRAIHAPLHSRPQVQSTSSSSSLSKNLARKRADSLKWSKYNNLGAVTIELDLSNDELRRV